MASSSPVAKLRRSVAMLGFYQFAGQRSRNKDRLAGGCGLVRSNARQAVAAIDRLLDAQLHAWLI